MGNNGGEIESYQVLVSLMNFDLLSTAYKS